MKSFSLLLLNAILLVSFNYCNAKKDIIAIGQAMVDVSVECENDEELVNYTHGLVKKGDSSVINSEHVRQLALITSKSKKSAGGAGANVIAGIASLGGNVALVSSRGDDAYGQLFNDDMQNFGVKHFGSIIPNTTTGVVYSIITKTDGERTMLASSGASHSIKTVDLSIERLQQYKMLLSEAYMWYSDYAAEIVKEKFKVAREHGIKIVFTLCSPYVVKTFKDQFIDLLSSVDILVGNEEEFYTLCGTEDLLTIYKKMQKIVPMTVITRAKQGADIVTQDRIIHVPVEQSVENVVDTTGAGDIFLAGFLYGQTHDMDIRNSARLGHTLASKIIQQVGARPEFDTKEILARFRSNTEYPEELKLRAVEGSDWLSRDCGYN